MTKLNSRPASLCHPRESATLADTNLRDVNYSREEPPRRSTSVGDLVNNKEQYPLYPKIHIPIGIPGMHPGYPLTNTDRTQNEVLFDHPHKNQVIRSQKQVIFGPHTKTKSTSTLRTKARSISFSILYKTNFDPPHKNQVNFDLNSEIKSISVLDLKSNQFR